jgi:site-specific DNA recombinase
MRKRKRKNHDRPARAVIYCRVSTKKQVKGESLGEQLRQCEEYCARSGWEVDQTFIEGGEDGNTTQRTALQRMLAYCATHRERIGYVVVKETSRWTRVTADYYLLLESVELLGIGLRSATQPIDESPAGRLVGGMSAVYAQHENDLRRERVVGGMQARVRKGAWPFQPAIGYQKRIGRNGATLQPDPATAPLVRLAFELIDSGRNRRQALETVTAQGLRSSRTGKPLSAKAFEYLLRNPMYAGRRRVHDWDLDVQGDSEAIVPPDLFDRVQRRLTHPSAVSGSRGDRTADFPLRRLLKCSCGRYLTASWSKGRGNHYGYYHCTKCGQTRLSASTAEASLQTRLQSLRPDSSCFELFRAILVDVGRKQGEDGRKAAQTLKRNLQELRERERRLTGLLLDRKIDQRAYDGQLLGIREEIDRNERELDELATPDDDMGDFIEFADYVVNHAAEFWESADTPAKQQFQQLLFPAGIRCEGKQVGTGPTALFFSLLGECQGNSGIWWT